MASTSRTIVATGVIKTPGTLAGAIADRRLRVRWKRARVVEAVAHALKRLDDAVLVLRGGGDKSAGGRAHHRPRRR